MQVLSEGIEICNFEQDGEDYGGYTPLAPMLFVARSNKSGGSAVATEGEGSSGSSGDDEVFHLVDDIMLESEVIHRLPPNKQIHIYAVVCLIAISTEGNCVNKGNSACKPVCRKSSSHSLKKRSVSTERPWSDSIDHHRRRHRRRRRGGERKASECIYI